MKLLVALFYAIVGVSTLTYSPVANPQSVITFGRARFTVLTQSLIRLELAAPPHQPRQQLSFDDRPTIQVVNRLLATPKGLTVTKINDTTIQISTNRFTLTHIANYLKGDTCSHPQQGKDQVGGKRVPKYPNGYASSSQSDCCNTCNKDDMCTVWVYEPNKGGENCWLMMDVQGTTNAPDRVFGGTYGGSGFTSENLQISFPVNEKIVTWVPGTPNNGNLKGTLQALDCYSTKEQCYNEYMSKWEDGLLSKDGWYLLDDTMTARYNDDIQPIPNDIPWFEETFIDQTDMYFFAHGLDYRSLLGDYSKIGGSITIPPRTAFGIWWSRYYPYSESTFNSEILDGYKQNDLPLSHVVLDMDWHIEPKLPGCQSWGGYTFNTQLFPDPQQYLTSLHSSNNDYGKPLKVLLNIHPQTGVDHCQTLYPQFARDMGVNPSTNATIPCAFGDETFAMNLFKVFLNSQPLSSVDYWWTDYGGCTGPNGREMYWSNYYFDAHLQLRLGKRPLVLSRFGGLGNHRYPIGFSGDTFQAFLTLEFLVQMTPAASNVLFGYWSHDVGGFHSGNGSPGDGNPSNVTGSELYLRWIQFASVSPIFRTHCDHCERRIWVFPHFFWMKHAFYLRNALVPYSYTNARYAFDSGISIVYPLYYDYPTANEAYQYKMQYMFGGDILAAPIAYPTGSNGLVSQTIWLPTGTSWSNWNGTKVYPGGSVIKENYGVQDIPMFVKVGTAIPLQSETAEVTSFADPLIWAIFPGANSGLGIVYEDDGEALDYINNIYATTSLTYNGGPDASGVNITINPTIGKYNGKPNSRSHAVQLRGVSTFHPNGPRSVTCNGIPIPHGNSNSVPGWYITNEYGLATVEGSLVVSVGNYPTEQVIKIVVIF